MLYKHCIKRFENVRLYFGCFSFRYSSCAGFVIFFSALLLQDKTVARANKDVITFFIFSFLVVLKQYVDMWLYLKMPTAINIYIQLKRGG